MSIRQDRQNGRTAPVRHRSPCMWVDLLIESEITIDRKLEPSPHADHRKPSETPLAIRPPCLLCDRQPLSRS